MIPSNRRLTTEFFEKTIAGQSFHSSMVSIKAIMSPEKTTKASRFAVIASKKNFKTAVARNNMRRRVYSALAPLLPQVTDGFFVVILTKPEMTKLKMPELRSAIESIFNKAGIMQKTPLKVK